MGLPVESRAEVNLVSLYGLLSCVPEQFYHVLVKKGVRIVVVNDLKSVSELNDNGSVWRGCSGIIFEQSLFVEQECAQKSVLHDLGHVLDYCLGDASQEEVFEQIVSQSFAQYALYNQQRQELELREWFARGFVRYCLSRSFVQKIGFAFWYPETRKYFVELERRMKS